MFFFQKLINLTFIDIQTVHMHEWMKMRTVGIECIAGIQKKKKPKEKNMNCIKKHIQAKHREFFFIMKHFFSLFVVPTSTCGFELWEIQ